MHIPWSALIHILNQKKTTKAWLQIISRGEDDILCLTHHSHLFRSLLHLFLLAAILKNYKIQFVSHFYGFSFRLCYRLQHMRNFEE